MSQTVLAGLFVFATPGLALAEIRGQLFDHIPQRAWLETYDPTLVSSRYFSEFIYESYDDADLFKNENTLRWGIPLRDDLALGLQMMVPLKWIDSSSADDFGLGDHEIRAGIVGRLAPDVRFGLAMNVVFDTATESSLGDGAFVLRPIAAIRWDVTERLNLGCNVEYNVTPVDEGASDVSALELKFPIAFKITDDWSGFVSYNPRWDFLAESDRHRLESGVTMTFGADHQYAISFTGEIPLTSESFEFKLASGFSWYF
jgi:hypothetical protein